LDEPSSSLDAISEREIFNIVLDEFRSKTIIMISHRLANIKNADKIYFFENGVIKEMGTHEQLMSLKKDYYNLYITQAQGYTNQDLC
jgi:ABC-type multidrug transport system fused ATPase/permease subunit